ncbi:hypothetical protein O181_105038 [Austropuccinia psidii MF-1]|uniref:Uncharacterized protein n=1 Tax=Austropuccinia psidii MF-1 TaxID=1389203 RepID=A0A9Q3PKL2_9BASI|nr:hypothetical protein [Austropuccinia psidii MF-1]
MEVDSSEDYEDSEDSLSKSISPSDSLPSATELNKSEVTLGRSGRFAIGSKPSQRKSHRPETSLRYMMQLTWPVSIFKAISTQVMNIPSSL